MAESIFQLETPGMSWGLASAKLHISQISAVEQTFHSNILVSRS